MPPSEIIKSFYFLLNQLLPCVKMNKHWKTIPAIYTNLKELGMIHGAAHNRRHISFIVESLTATLAPVGSSAAAMKHWEPTWTKEGNHTMLEVCSKKWDSQRTCAPFVWTNECMACEAQRWRILNTLRLLNVSPGSVFFLLLQAFVARELHLSLAMWTFAEFKRLILGFTALKKLCSK